MISHLHPEKLLRPLSGACAVFPLLVCEKAFSLILASIHFSMRFGAWFHRSNIFIQVAHCGLTTF
jgi:hypothetical protein